MSGTRKTGLTLLILCCICCCGLYANTMTVDLSSIANAPFNTAAMINGAKFPTGSNVFGGIPFAIPSGPNNAWFGYATATPSGTETVVVHPNTIGSTTAYTLLNTMWGEPGTNLKFTFIGSAGAIYTYFMTSGIDVRDYNNGSINGIGRNTTNVWNDQVAGSTSWQRLDMQTIQLPVEFRTQILSTIILTDDGASGIQRGIWSGLTIGTGLSADADPEPATIFLLGSGLIAVCVWRKRLRT